MGSDCSGLVTNRTEVVCGPSVASIGEEKACPTTVELARPVTSGTKRQEASLTITRKLKRKSPDENLPLLVREMKEVSGRICVVEVKGTVACDDMHHAGSGVGQGAEGEGKGHDLVAIEALITPAKLKPISGQLSGNLGEHVLQGLAREDEAGVLPVRKDQQGSALSVFRNRERRMRVGAGRGRNGARGERKSRKPKSKEVTHSEI